MKVRVKVFATLSQYVPEVLAGTPLEVKLPNGATLEDLFNQINIPADEVKTVFVNGRAQPSSYVLQPDDEVGIFPPIAGG
jgi:molybdopterin converting factor small subunit